MPTPRKAGIIEQLTDKLKRSSAMVLMQTQGLTVADQTDLRKKLHGNGIDFQVVKNTLLRIATKDAGVADLDADLVGPTAVAIGYADEGAVAKAVMDYIRTSKIVTVKAGMIGRQSFNAKQVEDLARLPGRQELRSQNVGVIQGPLNQTYSLLSAPTRDLVQVLRNYAEKQGATFD